MAGLIEILERLGRFATDWWPTTLVSLILATPFLVLIWWLWWRLPKRQMRSVTASTPKERADIEDNFRKTVGQALGGIFVLIGAVSAYLQFSQQQQAAHDLLISNQVSRGFEQLAGERMEMRLGGIYALEGVMNSSQQYEQQVLETLCAFVRDHTAIGPPPAHPATDVQAVLTVLGRRFNRAKWEVDLSYAKLRGANLQVANLSGVNFRGTDLSGANLANANLSGAFMVEAYFTSANMIGTNLSEANVTNAHFDDAQMIYMRMSEGQLSQGCGSPRVLPRGGAPRFTCEYAGIQVGP